MNNYSTGSLIIWVLALLTLPLWLLSFPESTINHNLKPFFVYSSQAASLVGFALFALSFVLATRLSWLEDCFGGLDRVYHFHHSIARIAVVLLILHALLLALRWIPEDPGRLLWYLFPIHRRFEVNLGSWALWGLILLMILTITIKIPYDKWKVTHKFMGIFFILGVSHIFFLKLSFSANLPLLIYLSVLSAVGIVAWIYKSILFDLIVHKFPYRVEKVHRINDKIMDIEMSPEDEKIQFTPGQFYFFSFRDKNISTESHPYTICEENSEGNIRIMVKSLGDYTTRLHQVIKPGMIALLEGPYGRFDFSAGEPKQVWIAGGVGIAPFISWANELLARPRPELQADLYYCVNTKSDATHLDLFSRLKESMPGFTLNLLNADEMGFIKAGEIPGIRDKDIYICGPKPMREAILTSFKPLKISRKSIHYEDFDFS